MCVIVVDAARESVARGVYIYTRRSYITVEHIRVAQIDYSQNCGVCKGIDRD